MCRPSFALRAVPALFGAAFAFSCLLSASPARADFAAAPDSPYRYSPPPDSPPPAQLRDEREPRRDSQDRDSTFRFNIGPALLVNPVGPGLFTALDIGRHAVGVRGSATWLRAEQQKGLAAYGGELWIDLLHDGDLHPIIGAGASWLHGTALDTRNLGAGSLRGALEYELPLQGASARLGLSLSVLVPAIGNEATRPWAFTAVTVGAGF
jgi:hypothetical protein